VNTDLAGVGTVCVRLSLNEHDSFISDTQCASIGDLEKYQQTEYFFICFLSIFCFNLQFL
jgi:hypothetical protein